MTWLPRAILLLAVVGLLALNVASLTNAGVYGLLSSAVELLVPNATIRTQTERRLASLQADLLDARANLGKAETDLSAAKAEKQVIEASLEQAQGGAQGLQDELEAKRRQIDELEGEVRVVRRRAADMERRWRGALQERNVARDELRFAAQRRVASEEAAKLARTRVDDLSRSIARRGVQVASANVSSMLLEAVPYFGIAVNVGATGLELSAACDTAKEMAQIRAAMDLDTAAIDEDNSTLCGMKDVLPTAEELWSQMTTDPEDLPKKACLQAREQGMPLPQGCENLPQRPDAETIYDDGAPPEPLQRPE